MLCGNVQTCTDASQVCIRFEFYSTTSQFVSVPSKFGMPMVFLVSRKLLASSAKLQGLGVSGSATMFECQHWCECVTSSVARNTKTQHPIEALSPHFFFEKNGSRSSTADHLHPNSTKPKQTTPPHHTTHHQKYRSSLNVVPSYNDL